MQSAIFKRYSQSVASTEKRNRLLLSELLAALMCDCFGKPQQESHTAIHKAVIRKVRRNENTQAPRKAYW